MAGQDDICFFAETNFRGGHRRFGIRRGDRRHHVYIIGKTGMGKSTLLENLIAADVRAGTGVAVLDPHGDLVKQVVASVPRDRQGAVIAFDPMEKRHALPFNLLKADFSQPHLIVSGILGAFKKIWGDSWGPRMEHIFRHVLLALTSFPDATLLHVPRVLTDKSFRERVVCYVEDPQVKAFFADEFEKYTPSFRSEAISPILNKVGSFLANPVLRHLLGHQENQVRFREMMDGGQVFLANLSKGMLGEDASALLGALLLAQIELSALSRAEIRAEERRDFYLYVDEFSNFATPSFVGMLSEARKYGVSLTLCNQFVSQLDEAMRAAVFGNVGTLITFQVGAEDAEYLAREFAPVFSEIDLVNLPKHHIYLKLMCEGKMSEPFSAVTLPPPDTS